MKLRVSNIVFSAVLFGLIICSSCSTKNQDSHIHEDSSVCEGHETIEQTMPDQESFKVEPDSDAVRVNSIDHDHDHGNEHNHKH
jgi:hypothetical protein